MLRRLIGARRRAVAWALVALFYVTPLTAQFATGIRLTTSEVEFQGVLELGTSTDLRTLPTPAGISGFPSGTTGTFVFNSPYGNRGWKVTDGDTTNCPSGDCLNSDHYTNWKQIFKHAGQNYFDVAYAYLDGSNVGVNIARVSTESPFGVTQRGRAFTSGPLNGTNGTGMFTSRQDPEEMYLYGADEFIYEVDCTSVPCSSTPIIDVTDYEALWGGTTATEAKSVTSDHTHRKWGMTVMGTGFEIGCLFVDLDDAGQNFYIPWNDTDPDETETGGDCAITLSGKYMITAILGTGESNDAGIWNTETTSFVRRWRDQYGAPGHNGYGFNEMGALDNYSFSPGGMHYWNLDAEMFTTNPCTTCTPSAGQYGLLYRQVTTGFAYEYPSFNNAVSGTAFTAQVMSYTAMGDPEPGTQQPREREIVVTSLDGSLQVVACGGSMTKIGVPTFGGVLTYFQASKPNFDQEGEFVMLNTNLGTAHMEGIVVDLRGCKARLLDALAPSPIMSSVIGAMSFGLVSARPEPRYEMAA